MSFALLGISAFQVYWINNVIQLSEERFEKDAINSLTLVAEKLERNEMVTVVANSFAFFGTSMGSDTGNVHIDKDVRITTNGDSVQGKFSYRSNANDNIKVIIRSESSEEIHEFIKDTVFTTVDINMVSAADENPEVAKRINTKQRVFTKVVEEMIFHEVRQPIRVHPVILDSMLRTEFNNHGIRIQYEFGIYDAQTESFRVVKAINEESLTQTTLKASLFPNDILNNGLSLMVNFPSKNQYLFEKVWLSLLVSLLFIVVIIGVFAYVVYKIIHQKKLADLKNDFINNMTHEFKTPLATVTLATEALSEDMVQSNQQMRSRYLQVIKEENTRLTTQVEKVLQLASLEQEELSFTRRQNSINELIESAASRARFQIEERDGKFQVKLLKNDLKFMADESHFSNALFNLLDNAIKYSTGPPYVELTAKVKKGELVISITDQGIGLSTEQKRQVFDKFYRVPTGNLHDVKGFGLGLNYVKYIIEAHGGRIELNSVLGEGSSFSIHFRLDQSGI